MHLGVYIFPTDYSIQPVELAVALEERGFESLFVPEHTHIPVSRRTPWPGGGPLPMEYSHTHDPFVALSFAAAATKKLVVGTAISLLPQRDAIVTAKVVAARTTKAVKIIHVLTGCLTKKRVIPQDPPSAERDARPCRGSACRKGSARWSTPDRR